VLIIVVDGSRFRLLFLLTQQLFLLTQQLFLLTQQLFLLTQQLFLLTQQIYMWDFLLPNASPLFL
jgi:hypothetical protein